MSSIPHNKDKETEVFDSIIKFIREFQVGRLLFMCNARKVSILLSSRIINGFIKPLTDEKRKDVFIYR